MGKRFFGLGFIVIVVWYSLWMIQPPTPKSAAAPADAFSAERAFSHITAIGQKPHPLGSEENKRVRQYIISELQKMGLQPSVQQGIAIKRASALAGKVSNVVVKIPGTNPEQTLLLMTHYDSVPNGPGAGDDGLGVSSILETLRAVKSRGPLKNNLWVLFTNGEERGLLGAEYFIQADDDWKEVDLAINVEARGTGGPSIMFETSSGNENLIPHFTAAAGRPVANSLSYTVYKIIPNDTDLSVFKRAGINALNYANIEGLLNYHTMQDQPENVSKATLQHHGQNLFDTVLYFGNKAFNAAGKADIVYFSGLLGGLIYYPSGWSFPLALAGMILLVICLAWLFYKGRLSPGKYLLAMMTFLVVCGAGVLLTYAGWQVMKALHPGYRWLAHMDTYARGWYLWGFSSLMLALGIGTFGWLQKKLKPTNLIAGILSVVVILSLLVAWYLPTAGYLLSWPAIFAVTALFPSRGDTENPGIPTLTVLCLAAFPALFIITPYVPLIHLTLTTTLLWAAMLLLMLLIGLCWPLIALITRRRSLLWSGILVAIFFTSMIGASLNSGFSPQQKKQNSIIYAQDLDTNQSLWLSSDHATDEWTRQFLGQNPGRDFNFDYSPYWSAPFLQAPAPYIAIEPPEVELISEQRIDNNRKLQLRVQSPHGGLTARFMLTSGQPFTNVSIGGIPMFDEARPLPGQRSQLNQFYYFGDVSEAVELTVAFPVSYTPPALDVQIISKKWPAGLMQQYDPRAEYMMPIPFGISDAVIFKKSFSLGRSGE